MFAGSTVVLSLLGLFLLGLPFIYGAALGAIIAVLLVMAASVTLLPAALGFAGQGIDRLHAGNAGVLTVVPRTSPQDARTSALVQRLRNVVVPGATAHTGVRALVGGETAASIDTAGLISRHLVLVVAFVILVAAFRSVTIPLVSALLTLLSTGAAYGVIVAVFQWGWLGAGIDNGATAPVDPWIPLMLFALLFGFSMDYQVFLVSRIREEWRDGAGDAGAVTNGLAATGRVITSAAAIMVCVFGAFVLGDLRVLRVMGLGMAVAVLLDATIVRMVLMPSALQLMGRANWWFPGRLERVVPSFLSEIRTEPRARGAGG